MNIITLDKKQEIEAIVADLEKKFESCEDFGEKLEIKDKIHNYKMILNGTKPLSSEQYFCEGCSA